MLAVLVMRLRFWVQWRWSEMPWGEGRGGGAGFSSDGAVMRGSGGEGGSASTCHHKVYTFSGGRRGERGMGGVGICGRIVSQCEMGLRCCGAGEG